MAVAEDTKIAEDMKIGIEEGGEIEEAEVELLGGAVVLLAVKVLKSVRLRLSNERFRELKFQLLPHLEEVL